MSELTPSAVLRFCFFGGRRHTVAARLAVLSAWCFALAVVVFNAVFPFLFEDGNLLVRGVCTLVLAAPLVWLYLRGKRALGAEIGSPR